MAAVSGKAKAYLVHSGKILGKDPRLRRRVAIGYICNGGLFTEVLAGC